MKDGDVQVLIPLLVALWSMVAPNLTVHRLDGPVQFTDLYGNAREAEAALGCPSTGPELWLSPTVDVETLVHELAHAHDCLDNGAMDASPTLRPAVRPAWVSDYCWESDAEWYACSVVHFQSITPHEVAGWPEG
jgi:hypothetical protein